MALIQISQGMSNPTIRQYLIGGAGIPEIEPEEFGKKLTEEFMSKQKWRMDRKYIYIP